MAVNILTTKLCRGVRRRRGVAFLHGLVRQRESQTASGKRIGTTGPLTTGPQRWKAEMLVRSEKTCVSEGESPSSLEARLPEFGTKVMNGKV